MVGIKAALHPNSIDHQAQLTKLAIIPTQSKSYNYALLLHIKRGPKSLYEYLMYTRTRFLRQPCSCVRKYRVLVVILPNCTDLEYVPHSPTSSIYSCTPLLPNPHLLLHTDHPLKMDRPFIHLHASFNKDIVSMYLE